MERIGSRDFFSVKNVFTARSITAMAALLAIRTLLGLPFLTIYVGGVKLITFAYLCDAAAAMMYGPIAGLAFGFAGDTLGFFASMSSGGAYFPGYAASEMLTCLIFASLLYKRKVSWPRISIAWAFNLALVNLGLNTLWLILVWGLKATEAVTLFRVILNLGQMIIHIPATYFAMYFIKKHKKLLIG